MELVESDDEVIIREDCNCKVCRNYGKPSTLGMAQSQNLNARIKLQAQKHEDENGCLYLSIAARFLDMVQILIPNLFP
jgi:hypothetical protein